MSHFDKLKALLLEMGFTEVQDAQGCKEKVFDVKDGNISLGEGKGYIYFGCTFVFDPDGSFKEHSCYE